MMAADTTTNTATAYSSCLPTTLHVSLCMACCNTPCNIVLRIAATRLAACLNPLPHLFHLFRLLLFIFSLSLVSCCHFYCPLACGNVCACCVLVHFRDNTPPFRSAPFLIFCFNSFNNFSSLYIFLLFLCASCCCYVVNCHWGTLGRQLLIFAINTFHVQCLR